MATVLTTNSRRGSLRLVNEDIRRVGAILSTERTAGAAALRASASRCKKGVSNMGSFGSGLVAGITSGTVLAAVLGLLLARRTEQVKREVETQFMRLSEELRSQRGWKERSVSDLLGPLCIQLDRTNRAFGRWREKNLFLEIKVIREANLIVRDLLLGKPHLIPPELFGNAAKLIEHYDRWLEEYERIRQAENPDLNASFVFVGPAGYPFPQESEVRFREVYDLYWKELYG
jgi:hypothetical protein